MEKLIIDISEKDQEHSRFIKHVLKDDFYSGVTRFRKSHVLKGTRTTEDQYITVKDHHEAVISPEIWRAVQKTNKNNKK